MNRRGRGGKPRGKGRTGRVQRSMGLQRFGPVIQPPLIRRRFSLTDFLLVNGGGATVGASVTVQGFSGASSPFNGAANTLPGWSDLWATTVPSNAGYYNFKVLGISVRASVVSQETFNTRAAIAITLNEPATGALTTKNLQVPYLAQQNCVCKHLTVGPLTGKGGATMQLSGTLKQLAANARVPGLIDQYANYYSPATANIVDATAGMSVVFMALAPVNLTNGILFDYTIDFYVELWGLNSQKTS